MSKHRPNLHMSLSVTSHISLPIGFDYMNIQKEFSTACCLAPWQMKINWKVSDEFSLRSFQTHLKVSISGWCGGTVQSGYCYFRLIQAKEW